MKNKDICQNKHNSQKAGILAVVLVVALSASACGISLPLAKIETGPTQTVSVQIPMPEDFSGSAELNLEFLTGQLMLSPESARSEYLVSGSATFNAFDFEPTFDSEGSGYTLRQGEGSIGSFPVNQDDLENEWDLQLAAAPMRLHINAGPYSGYYELGGLALEELTISEVGSDVTCAFSTPNLVEMTSFTYDTGGSNLVLTGLANANFAQMTFTAGAGDYTLSFDGDLQRDANVTIDAGVGKLNIIVPEDVNAQITFEGTLTSINLTGGWLQNGNTYTLSGSGPTITITVKMGAGTLNLKTESRL